MCIKDTWSYNWLQIYNYFTPLTVFHTNVSRWFFTGVSESKSPQISGTLLSILADIIIIIIIYSLSFSHQL